MSASTEEPVSTRTAPTRGRECSLGSEREYRLVVCDAQRHGGSAAARSAVRCKRGLGGMQPQFEPHRLGEHGRSRTTRLRHTCRLEACAHVEPGRRGVAARDPKEKRLNVTGPRPGYNCVDGASAPPPDRERRDPPTSDRGSPSLDPTPRFWPGEADRLAAHLCD